MSEHCELLRVIRHNCYHDLGNGSNKFGYHCFSGTGMVVERMHLLCCANCFQVSSHHGAFHFGSSGCTFHGTGFTLLFSKKVTRDAPGLMQLK